ncbi:TspO/MBR family protein [Psychrobacillus sp. FJAT-51614]|uniref:TspO/MBR family protein n=1 Tax=Psychrobacillus mangrovi TaxID=3117745 RepID=A0ABU8F841_9BACI
MIKIIFLIISLFSTIMVNILANTLPINHQTTGEISNRLPSLFTPASYVFLIWIAIYLLLAYWIWNIVKEFKSGESISATRVILFVSSSILNILWIFFWHYELFLFALIDIFALLGVLFILYKTYSSDEQLWIKRLPISIYLGWIFVATFDNIDYYLTYVEFGGWGMTKSLWVVIFLTIATAIALHIRFHYNDPVIVLVFIWAFIGIAYRHMLHELLITSASIFLSFVLIVGILFIKKMPRKS